MANHAYVIPDKLPSADQIHADAEAIVKRKFPQFTLKREDDTHWRLDYKDDGYLAFLFWLDEYQDPDTFDEATETWSRTLPCIEFRHGHSHQFMWWVEYEIREELARLYNAKVVDDAECTFDPPQLERYNTYQEYLVKTHLTEIQADPKWKDILNRMLDLEREAAPDELKPLIGDNIE